MKRSGFKRKTIERKPFPLFAGTGRGVIVPSGDAVVSRPKDAPIRSEPYRRLVASLPCDRCKVEGYSQAAHSDQGKGLSIKACDLTCYPLCGPRPDVMVFGLYAGCHWVVGTSGTLSREERREYEAEAGARTRLKLLVMAQDDAKARKVLRDVGMWPKSTGRLWVEA